MYVFTFGWSPEFVIQPLVKDGVDKKDYVLLLTNKPESEFSRKKFEEAYQQIVSFFKFTNLSNILEYREIDLNKDFTEICVDVMRILNEYIVVHKPSVIKAYLSGGMRVLVLAVFAVTRLLYLKGLNVEVYTSREDRPIIYKIPANLLTLDIQKITKEQLELLKMLNNLGSATVEALAIGRARDTTRKLLAKLKEKNLVTHTTLNRKHVYKLTPLGKLAVAAIGD